MGTKTIGLRDDAYERLKARKREGESFTELVNRLLDESKPDWREGFGSLSDEEGEELERIVEESRKATSTGFAERQMAVLEELSEGGECDDKTA